MSTQKIIIWILVAIAIAVGGFYFFYMGRETAVPTTPAATSPATAPATPAQPK